jgi:tryptophan halogenase|tara:strand:- start:130 stop:1608 length:1479 start_codon:yes stop_codon:yes gene_type:complete
MKIVVVGGGTAGWLAALMISKIRPDHTVTCIESSKIGIIGAGEGSTGSLTNIVQNEMFDFGCNEQDFIKECDATIKLGIKHIGWNEDPSKFYYGPIDGTPTSNDRCDIVFQHALGYRDQNYLHLATELGYKIHHNKNSFVQINGNHAYHFDAHKVGQYFKKICDTVTHIDSEVEHVQLDSESGFVRSVKLSNGDTVQGDMFIDASGFNQVLMKAVGGKWKSYKENLPVNGALPFLLPYEDDEVIQPVTNAWAQNNGWCWQIPTKNRRGCGYVFSDEFVTPDQAHAELEQTIGRKVDPIRHIKFDSGRQETLWIKNVLSIGLCAAFAEPLEATSIHTTIMQLKHFVYGCLGKDQNDTCNIGTVDDYNKKNAHLYDTMKDFLVAHYTCGRKDTDFWKYINSGATSTDFVNSMHEVCKHRVPNATLFPRQEGSAGWPLWSYVLAGTGALKSEVAEKEVKFNDDEIVGDSAYAYHVTDFDNMSKDLPDNTDYIRNM